MIRVTLALLLSMSLVACGGSEKATSPNTLDSGSTLVTPSPGASDHSPENFLIPVPTDITPSTDTFDFTDKSIALIIKGDVVANQIYTSIFEDFVINELGFTVVSEADSNLLPVVISLIQEGYEPEAYSLTIDNNGVLISAADMAGVQYALTTLSQLLLFELAENNATYSLNQISINDKPRYAYRGAMLDVARHFFSVDQVKRYLDYLTFYKFNTLHLHLTDDQGWRIDISTWPNLTMHGGSTQVGGGEGGYYTQQDYIEIVEYSTLR